MGHSEFSLSVLFEEALIVARKSKVRAEGLEIQLGREISWGTNSKGTEGDFQKVWKDLVFILLLSLAPSCCADQIRGRDQWSRMSFVPYNSLTTQMTTYNVVCYLISCQLSFVPYNSLTTDQISTIWSVPTVMWFDHYWSHHKYGRTRSSLILWWSHLIRVV